MKIMILGADGMLGHQLVASFRYQHEVAGTVRLASIAYSRFKSLLPDLLFDEVDVRDFNSVERAAASFRPDAIVNAVGIVKQRDEAKSAIESIVVNSLLPHRLAEYCCRVNARLVHLSTDCVFSGSTGSYEDDAIPDALDIYGRSKMMGEVVNSHVITLRTSIIGLELARKKGLVEWFLTQSGTIRGFRRAIYSGFTTLEMARIIDHLLVRCPEQYGIYNVSSEPIDKYRLLCGLRERLGIELEIVPDDQFQCDRSLDSSRFRAAFGYTPPSWDAMLDELAEQIKDRLRKGGSS